MFVVLNFINNTNANKYLNNKLQNFAIYKLSRLIKFMSIIENYRSRTRENVFNTFIYLEDINNRKLQKKIVVFLF